MGDQEETQEQMKADMSALKEQMASMMEAMLGMRQLMENNMATTAAVSSAAEADPTLPATAHHPLPNAIGREGSKLGHISNPHLGYNQVAYPYGLPPNYMPPVMHDDAGHVPPLVLEGEPPRQSDEVHEDHREYAQVDVDFYPSVPVEGPAPNVLPQPNLPAQPIFLAPAPIQREASQAPAPTTTRPAGNAHFGTGSNAMRNFPPKPTPEFTPIPMTYEDLLPSLIANQMAVISPGKIYQPPFPKWYNPDATCTYHGKTPGHSTKKCLALKYKVQHLIDAGWLTFLEDRPNVKTNLLANHRGGAVNAVESGRPRRSKPLKDLTTPRRFIYEALQKGGVIPHGGHEEDSCLMHPSELHNMETCLAVEDLLQQMIDRGRLEVSDEGREEQRIYMQSVDERSFGRPKPLVVYFTKDAAPQTPRYPSVVKPVSFPYRNSHAVPWRYAPPSERKEEATDISSLSAKVTNSTGLSGVTRNSRVFAPPDLPTQPANVKGKAKMVEEQNDKTTLTSNEDIPVKGKNNGGRTSLISTRGNRGKFGLGYKPTQSDIRKSVVGRKSGSQGSQLGRKVEGGPPCHISRSFISAGLGHEGQVVAICEDDSPSGSDLVRPCPLGFQLGNWRVEERSDIYEMAPKKLSTKRSRRDAAAEGPSATPEFDSHHFRSAEHQQHFEAIKGWSFHREKCIQLREDEYTDFQEEIARRH
ncbi:hypothetical protein GmHk_15G044444 [Glycine max]|nr:hypothetical protein GmHk_15G044444 [Glycine max]